MAKKEFIRKFRNEEEAEYRHDAYSTADAVCWAPGRTIGNIAVSTEEVLGMFTNKTGDDALLPCQIIPCGKFRNGAERWYCKTHQIHWGTKADFAAIPESNEVICSNHSIKMSYVVNPLEIEFKEYEEIGIWCSLPPGLSSETIDKRPPKIHVHKRFTGEHKKVIDQDFDAVVCTYDQELELFPNKEITRIQVTPPAAFEFVKSLEEGRHMSCVFCKRCGYPHLDLGDFANKPHSKHFCGNCGNDSIWSPEPIVSTPLKPLHDKFNNSNKYIVPNRNLNLDDYSGYSFEVWASTPAVVWTADRPQEKGIHVHVCGDGRRIIDDTYTEVKFQGKKLDRFDVWRNMLKNIIY